MPTRTTGRVPYRWTRNETVDASTWRKKWRT
jgi:hypothetical protein